MDVASTAPVPDPRLPDTCIDQRLPRDDAPVGSTGVNLLGKLWNKRTLTVSFIGGNAFQRSTVEREARTWERHADIDFSFVSAGGDIRVAFVPGGGNRSYIGSDAAYVAPNAWTLNLDGNTFVASTPVEQPRRKVLHEFGHALGLVHEHQSPNASIPCDRGAVYADYAAAPNFWSRQMVDENVFDRYGRTEVNATAFDRDSIMLYPIDEDHTVGDYEVPWNNSLSVQDIAFIGALYPEPAPPPPLVAQAHVRTERFECRKTSDRGCTAFEQRCISPQRPGTRLVPGRTNVSVGAFYGRQPICRLESRGAGQICLTGYVESGSGGSNINAVFTVDCRVGYVDAP